MVDFSAFFSVESSNNFCGMCMSSVAQWAQWCKASVYMLIVRGFALLLISSSKASYLVEE